MTISLIPSTITVDFYGTELFVITKDGEPYTPMKPIVEGMGLAWQAQHRKLTERFSKGITEMVIPTSSGSQTMTCLSLRKLAGWLHTISPNKVKPEIRNKVIQYQDECDDVLYRYWTQGEVVNPRKSKPTTKALPNCLTVEQQEAIKAIVNTRVGAVPQDKKAKAAITLWSSLKSKFGVSYKEILETEFTEALNVVARVVIEGEILDAEPKGMKPFAWTRLTDDITAESGYVIIDDVKNWVSDNLPHDIGCDFFDAMHDLQRVIVRGTTEMQEAVACFKMGIRYLNRFRGVNTR